jgi:hypothetical protein
VEGRIGEMMVQDRREMREKEGERGRKGGREEEWGQLMGGDEGDE